MGNESNNEESLDFHVAQLNEAFEALKGGAGKDYQAAKLHAPDLVEIESNPLRYLKFHEYDYKAAALSVSRYWEHRRFIFGEQSYQPVTDLGGTGALQGDELCLLQSGFISLLPSDIGGSPILCFDDSRVSKCSNVSVSLLHRMRCFFYWMQMASMNDQAAESGVVHIRILGAVRSLRSDFSRNLALMEERWPELQFRATREH